MTPCREDEFLPEEEWEALARHWARLQKEDPAAFEKLVRESEGQYADSNYSPVDVRGIPRFCPREVSGWQRVERGTLTFALLFVLFIGFLTSAVYIFRRYDLR